MKRLFLLIMLLCGSQVWAAENDVLLNLQDPTATSPFTPTLKVTGQFDGQANPTVKVPTQPCVANAAAPTWPEGSIVPCSVDLAGALRTSAGGGGGGTSSTFGAAFPATGTAAGFSDGTNMQGGRVYDTDSGVGTEFTVGAADRCAASGGSTACFPPTATSGDAVANQTATFVHGFEYMFNGATWDRIRGTIAGGLLVNVSNASLAVTGSLGRTWTLASGTDSVTATVSNAFLLDATFTARINTLGQKTMAASTPVVLPSDQSAIPVTVLSTVASANNDGTCPSGAVSFTVAASNASRTWLALWASPANTDDVFIKLGVTATSADGRIAPGQPINFTAGRIYTGQIDAFPNSGTQAVCVMELN